MIKAINKEKNTELENIQIIGIPIIIIIIYMKNKEEACYIKI
jgi:hypothetical protein